MAEQLRWHRVEEERPCEQGELFPELGVLERHVGTGEYRGLEFLHVRAGRVINRVPKSSQMPFRWTINAYRGCSHACTYCSVGDTPVLMADGRAKALAEVRPGDQVYGTVRQGSSRRCVPTPVLDHWQTVQPAWRVTLEDGRQLVTSGDHRFLTERGWKHVSATTGVGPGPRPHLTTNNKLVGTARLELPPKVDADYRQGYLCGVVRGGGGEPPGADQLRPALTDVEALGRTAAYLEAEGVEPRVGRRSIRATGREEVERVRRLIEVPVEPSPGWVNGFLAGIYDARGSHSLRNGIRIGTCVPEIAAQVVAGLDGLGFDTVVEAGNGPDGLSSVRLRGGLAERLRFLQAVDPAITRKRTITGTAVRPDERLRVVSVEPLGFDLPMYDITTGTGDFVANGVVSHNCFARPSHEWLGLGIGEDFERQIVVKVNAVERVRAELASRRWAGEPIAMGTNTDPYQPAEGKYRLTRGIVEALGEAANPFSILTKSTLILGDLERLVVASRRADVRINLSIGTLDEEVWRAAEPGTPHPRQRLAAVRRINQSGIPCGVLVAPILPGLSDGPDQVERVVTACLDAGAVSVSPVLLHLRPGVREHYLGWLGSFRPDLVAEYERRYAGRAYLPQRDQADLSAVVRRLSRGRC